MCGPRTAIVGRDPTPRTGSLGRVIDLRLLREDPDRVRASQRVRGEDVDLVDALLSADERRRSSGSRFDELRNEQRTLGKQVAKAQGEEKTALLQRTKALAEDFEPRDHVELGRILGAIDTERGAKVAGSRSYYLTGVGALLELALVNMA